MVLGARGAEGQAEPGRWGLRRQSGPQGAQSQPAPARDPGCSFRLTGDPQSHGVGAGRGFPASRAPAAPGLPRPRGHCPLGAGCGQPGREPGAQAGGTSQKAAALVRGKRFLFPQVPPPSLEQPASGGGGKRQPHSCHGNPGLQAAAGSVGKRALPCQGLGGTGKDGAGILGGQPGVRVRSWAGLAVRQGWVLEPRGGSSRTG